MFSFFRMMRFCKTWALPVCLALAVLAGCSTGGGSDPTKGLPEGLLGKWVADYGDWYQITRNGGTETLAISFDGTAVASEGAIRDVSNFTSQSGVIIVEYSRGHTNPDRPFGAVYYLDFNGTSVSFNSAWDSTAVDWDANTATLAAAKARFTQGSMGNWIDPSSAVPYTKQL
jgi:hypothetical protein